MSVLLLYEKFLNGMRTLNHHDILFEKYAYIWSSLHINVYEGIQAGIEDEPARRNFKLAKLSQTYQLSLIKIPKRISI